MLFIVIPVENERKDVPELRKFETTVKSNHISFVCDC